MPLVVASWFPITDDVGVLSVLSGICALFFWLERRTGWRLFQFFPPLVFIYLVPVILSNADLLPTKSPVLLPTKSPVYDAMKQLLLPMMLVLLLLKVDVGGAVRNLGRGVGVMLFGTLGVMVGAPLGLLVFAQWLEPESWRAFGTLAGSWIGGTGNMAAMGVALKTDDTPWMGLALLADSTLYLLWLPLLLVSKKFAEPFARFSKVDPAQLQRLEAASQASQPEKQVPTTSDIVSLLFVGLAATWAAAQLSQWLPVKEPYLSTDTWSILLITLLGVGLSLTPLRRIHGSHELAMAFVYLFVARMGATAKMEDISGQVLPFLGGASVMLMVHGAFCLLGAKLFRVDVHTAAIASAANIGGAASATIIASHHRQQLVPAGILMALLGYAVGNFAAYGTAMLCHWVS